MLKCVVQQEKAMMGNRLFYCSGISEWARVFLKVTGRMQVVRRRELCFQIHVDTLGPLTPPSGWSEQISHPHVWTCGDSKWTNNFLSRFKCTDTDRRFHERTGQRERMKPKGWERRGERGPRAKKKKKKQKNRASSREEVAEGGSLGGRVAFAGEREQNSFEGE